MATAVPRRSSRLQSPGHTAYADAPLVVLYADRHLVWRGHVKHSRFLSADGWGDGGAPARSGDGSIEGVAVGRDWVSAGAHIVRRSERGSADDLVTTLRDRVNQTDPYQAAGTGSA